VAARLEFANRDDLLQRYTGGESAKSLAGSMGVSRSVLYRLLREAGIEGRGRSDAERLKWAANKLDRSYVERMLSRAWKASTGRVDSFESKVRRASGFERAPSRIGLYEREVLALIPSDFKPQVAIGPFNADIASEERRIAVEIQSANHARPTSSIRPDRLEYILDAGWSVLVVFVRQHTTLNIERAAEQVIAFADVACRNPAARGEYGMIDGNAKPFTPKRPNLPRRPRVEGF
jgi:very-short-patch-repair endonuclease